MTVRVRFGYYFVDPVDGPIPSYWIEESDVKELPRHGNVSMRQLIKAGVKVPYTPTYDEWIKEQTKP